MKRFSIVCAAILLFGLLPLMAQVNATVGGTVSDASGAPMAKVEVRARNVDTGIVTTRATNDTGNYEFPSLQPGTYTISAATQGFRTTTFNNVQLSQNQQVRQNFTLEVSAGAQSVDVVAESDSLLATTSSSIGNTLPSSQLLSLPVQSRNVLDFVTTTAGVIKIAGVFGDVPVFAGTPSGQVNTTRDGLSTNDGRYNDSNGAYSAVLMSPDLVEEVQISVNTVDSALGRGSAQVQVRTRAGGNAFHGALFYTNNNSKLNANAWFDNLTGQEKSYTNRNQMGGRLGGPIKRNKAFFFVLIDDQRYLEKQTVTSTVLTATARAGIFRYLTDVDPNTGAIVSRRNGHALATAATRSLDLGGNILTRDPVDGSPLTLRSFNVFTDVKDPNRTKQDQVWIPELLKRMPLPNDYTVGDGLNTAGFHWRRTHNGFDGATGLSANPNRNHLTTRFDYQINDRNKLTYTMTREKDWGVTGQTGLTDYPNGYFGDIIRTPDFYTVGWSATIGANILNEFRFGLKRDTWYGTSPLDKGCCIQGAGENDLDPLALEARKTFPQANGYFLYTAMSGLPTGTTAVAGGLGRYADLNVSTPRLAKSPFMQFADTVSLIHGAHSFTAGFDVSFANSDSANGGGAQTTRPFVTLGVAANNVAVPNVTTANFPGLNASDVTTAQNLLANLAGSIRDIQEQFYIDSPTQTDWLDYRKQILFHRDFHQNDFSFFFKDNWKVSRSFTLTLGLRYDKYGVPYESHGLGGRFSGGRAGIGGQAALFGCSGSSFSAMWAPYAGCDTTKLTTTEFVGKDSPQPDKLIFGNDWNNFGPSIGFSWNVPWLKRTTVIRGGYGFNYAGQVDYLGYNTNIGNLPGQTLNPTFFASTYMDLATLPANAVPISTGGAVPFSAVPFTNRTAGITGYADDRVTPYIQTYNFSIQHELSRGLTLEVSYVGNQAHKLWSSIQVNETNIVENGILDAFNVTRAGGNAPLFDKMLKGLNVGGGLGVVNGTTLTGSQALRKLSTTNAFIANGDVGGLANFLNSTNSFTNVNGGILRNAQLPENFIVVNPQFGSVGLSGNNGNSTYNALETQITKRLSKGLSGQFSYTWSKALGDTSVAGAVRDPRNRQLSKGLQSIDRTHILKGYTAWDLPFGSSPGLLGNGPSWAKQIVGGWSLSGSFSWASGSPLSITPGATGFVSTIVNTVSSRAANTVDLVGALPSDFQSVVPGGNGVVQYFRGLTTKAAPLPNFGGDTSLPGRFSNQVVVDSAGNIIFAVPQPGKTGNTAQNFPGIRGPGSLGADLSLTKMVRIREGMNLSFRADAIRFLNKPIWGNPATNINAANFGVISTATGSRTITLNVRLDF
jgi:Carboxypeptidase regulatory-like domain